MFYDFENDANHAKYDNRRAEPEGKKVEEVFDFVFHNWNFRVCTMFCVATRL